MLDQTGYEPDTKLSPEDIDINEALDRLLEFFGPGGERWCPNGAGDEHSRRCIVMAAIAAQVPDRAFRKMDTAAIRRGFPRIIAFNDHPDTHWSDVVALIEEARR